MRLVKHRFRWGFYLGFAIGHVLGAKAGRERYEQIRSWWLRLVDGEPAPDAARGASNTYAPPGYEAELANLRGPGSQP